MTNPLFRSRLLNSIKFALSEAADARQLDHVGLVGRIREICCERLMRPMLPAGFEIGTGKITDKHGATTAEADLVIHCPAVLPPIMHSQRDGVFAVEASLYLIEVKSLLSATEIRDALGKARRLKELDSGVSKDQPLWTVPVLFAFGSDLDRASSELQRYAKYDAAWDTAPTFQAICVAGRGYWTAKSGGGWYTNPATDQHDEIVALVSGIANTLASRRHGLPSVPLGTYLMTERSA